MCPRDSMGAQLVVDHPPVHGRGGHEHVVAGADTQPPVGRLQLAGPGFDEHELVTDGVAHQRAVRVGRDVRQAHVVVGQQQVAVGDDVAAGLEVVRLQVPREQRVVGAELFGLDLDGVDGHDRRRRLAVVQQRGGRREALGPGQLLGVQRPVRASELGVTLARHVPESAVVRHACSPWWTRPAVMPHRALSSRACPLDARHRIGDGAPAGSSSAARQRPRVSWEITPPPRSPDVS